MIALAAALLIEAQAAAFAPPTDAVFDVVAERVQDDEQGRSRFRIERLIRFARDGEGWRAEVHLLAADAEASGELATMFEAGFARLAGRTLVFRLDAAGRVRGLDDRVALWDAYCRGVADIIASRRASDPADRAAVAERIATPLRMFAPEKQLELLGSLVDAIVAPDAPAPGSHAVRVPARSPFGGSVTLEGTESVMRAGALLRSHTLASAEVPVPAEREAGAGAGHVESETTRDVDPATGLFTAVTETVSSRIGSGAEVRSSRRVSTTRVTALPASAWPG